MSFTQPDPPARGGKRAKIPARQSAHAVWRARRRLQFLIASIALAGTLLAIRDTAVSAGSRPAIAASGSSSLPTHTSVTPRLAPRAPTGTLSINDGGAYAISVDVTLTSDVTGASEMRIGAVWSAVAGGDYHSLAVKTDDSLWTWGYNTSGQLGDGTTFQRTSPVQIGHGARWRAVSGGSIHSVAARRDGSLWAWGHNTYGQLGDGTTANRFEPVQVTGGATWMAVAGGGFHSVGIKTDHGLWAWGNNWYGQLGNGTTSGSNIPVRVGALTDWTACAAGYYHTLAIRTDGSLWAFGRNSFGQLGDGTTSQSSTPVRVGSDHNWARVAAGRDHSLALKTDGTIWAWGFNANGQLGDESYSQRVEPVQVGADSDWVEIAAGGEHSLARKSDGSTWSWGRNTYGQLGSGGAVDRNRPGRIGDSSRWGSVAGGNAHSLGLGDDGSLKAWGRNSFGQLGDGTTENRNGPVDVSDGAWSAWQAYSTATRWTLAPGDGTKRVYVEYRDPEGGTLGLSDDICLDTLAPSGSLSINRGDSQTSARAVTLDLTAVDTGSGVALMLISNDGVFDAETWEPFAPSKTWLLDEGDGDKTVHVRYMDLAGNVSRTVTSTVTLDTPRPPLEGTFWINSGDAYANSPVIDIEADVPGAAEMRLRNGGAPWTDWEAYAAATSWTLPSGDGPKTVDAEFRDESGTTLALSDDIYLDTTAPTGSISIDADAIYATSTAVNLTLTAADDGSGIFRMRISDDGVFDTEPWEDCQVTRAWQLTPGDGVKIVEAQYEDAAGNLSPTCADSIVLDTTPPSGTLSINQGDSSTNSVDVTLTSTVTDAVAMRFRNSGDSWASWTAYAVASGWTLTAGDGTKTVEAQYRDEAGNTSLLSDQIVLEPAAVTLAVPAFARPVVRYGTRVTLSASLTDGNGSALAGHDDVVLWSIPAGAASANRATNARASWTREGTATDLGDGTYQVECVSKQDTIYQMRHTGDAAYRPAASGYITVMCCAYLSRPWTRPRTLRRRRRFYIYGYLKPYHSGRTRLLVYRRVGRRWRYYSSPLARNYWYRGVTRYRLPYALRYPGYYLVRAYHRDHNHFSRTYGPYSVLRVR